MIILLEYLNIYLQEITDRAGNGSHLAKRFTDNRPTFSKNNSKIVASLPIAAEFRCEWR